MIKIRRTGDAASVTFALPLADAPEGVSVVGDFNGWDPAAHPMRKRSNGTRSAKVELDGAVTSFRYVASDGRWFNDPEAHRYEPNPHGEENGVIDLTN